MSEANNPTTPTLVSLLVCDQVIDDKMTNKKSAIGIFNVILVPQVPAQIHQLAILASVTEIVGRQEMELRLLRDSDNEVLFSGKGTVEAPNPLAIVDMLFALHGVRIPEAGQHAFELLAGGALLGRRRFQVLVRKKGAGPGGPPMGSFGGPPPAAEPPEGA